MASTLAMTDALTKLLIEKGVITDAEFNDYISSFGTKRQTEMLKHKGYQEQLANRSCVDGSRKITTDGQPALVTVP